jgi:ADP-ribosyl-[dinitrogen reductase] hydrolase
MEEVELFELGLHALPGQLRSLGIAWHLVPLAEGGVPDPSFDWRWAAVSSELATVLRQKGRVLIHCKDGLRRTGFVAARLLVEQGCRPEDAINRVRAARPGAIDSIEQGRYVLGVRRFHDLFEKG